MSSAVFRLSRRFCTQIKTAEPLLITLEDRTKDLYNEKDLSKHVETFTQFSESGCFRRLLRVFERTIARIASAKEFSLIEDLIEHHKKYEDIKKESFAVRLILVSGKAGMADHAHELFGEMSQRQCKRTVKSLNALLHVYVLSNKSEEAVKLFRELPLSMSIKPNVRTHTEVLVALCQKGDFDSAEKMLDEMESNGVKPNIYTFNTLVQTFYSQGRLEDGDRVWARMEKSGVEPDLISFNGKLIGVLPRGEISAAVKVLEELKRRKLTPNVDTCNILLKWYCNTGHLDEAKGVHDRLKKSASAPNGGTYRSLIQCSCEKQDLDFGLELCRESLSAKCCMNLAILQNVVNLLVQDSRVEEAEEVLELAYSIDYEPSKLKMPATIK